MVCEDVTGTGSFRSVLQEVVDVAVVQNAPAIDTATAEPIHSNEEKQADLADQQQESSVIQGVDTGVEILRK